MVGQRSAVAAASGRAQECSVWACIVAVRMYVIMLYACSVVGGSTKTLGCGTQLPACTVHTEVGVVVLMQREWWCARTRCCRHSFALGALSACRNVGGSTETLGCGTQLLACMVHTHTIHVIICNSSWLLATSFGTFKGTGKPKNLSASNAKAFTAFG